LCCFALFRLLATSCLLITASIVSTISFIAISTYTKLTPSAEQCWLFGCLLIEYSNSLNNICSFSNVTPRFFWSFKSFTVIFELASSFSNTKSNTTSYDNSMLMSSLLNSKGEETFNNNIMFSNILEIHSLYCTLDLSLTLNSKHSICNVLSTIILPYTLASFPINVLMILSYIIVA
jgi:hypothetical protein